jgi:2-oxoglutarate ferredoxin oxidoreductase subunit beta
MTATFSPARPIFCAGCGHFGVQAALEGAVDDLGIPRHDLMVIAGIGCSGTVQNNLVAYGYHALHGRVLPTATGMALANPSLTVVGAGGAGDGYAIGAGHLVHAFRRNPNLVYIVMNNGTYGLTKGQDSPTAVIDSSPAFDAVDLGLSIPAATFVARAFARRPDQLLRLTMEAIEHARSGHGFGFVEVLSPCVTYNDTYAVWDSTLHDVDEDPDYDSGDRIEAVRTSMTLKAEGLQPVGLIYRARIAEKPPVEPDAPVLGPVNLSLSGPATKDALGRLMENYRIY